MKTLFFTVLATILVSLPVHSSVISTFNGQINCDGLICSADSVSCTIAQKTTPDLSQITYTRTCIDAYGAVKDSKEETLPNPNPNTSINSVQIIGGSSSSSSRPLTEEEKQRMKEDFEKRDEAFKQWGVDFKRDLEASLKFPPKFPFHNLNFD